MTPVGEEWRGSDVGGDVRTDAESAHILSTARSNIRRLRCRDVALKLLDRGGQPVANTPVRIVQKRSAFPVGDQTWALDRMHRFGEWHADRARYWRLRFAELFNAATTLCYWTEAPRNDGPKTEDLQGHPRLDGFHACSDWAAAEGLLVKGHPLFWSIDKCVPDWVKRYDVATQMKFAEVRVRSLVASRRGRIAMWDAVNEPLWEAAPQNLASRHWPHMEPTGVIADYIAPVLRWAREEDPDAKYLVNDYGLEGDFPRGAPVARDGTSVTAALQRRRMLELIDALRQRGAAPDAVGLQSHTSGWLSPAQQWSVYEELAAPGLPLHVTEFWPPKFDGKDADAAARSEHDERVSQYVEEYLTVAFGHPSVEAFFFWGLMEHAVRWSTGDDRSAHTLTPVYHRVRKLLHETWRTNLETRSDEDGTVRFSGFLGQYSLRYRAGESDVGVAFEVGADAGAPQVLTLVHA